MSALWWVSLLFDTYVGLFGFINVWHGMDTRCLFNVYLRQRAKMPPWRVVKKHESAKYVRKGIALMALSLIGIAIFYYSALSG